MLTINDPILVFVLQVFECSVKHMPQLNLNKLGLLYI